MQQTKINAKVYSFKISVPQNWAGNHEMNVSNCLLGRTALYLGGMGKLGRIRLSFLLEKLKQHFGLAARNGNFLFDML